jgi:hypothetical protein
MIQADILRMAREAGLISRHGCRETASDEMLERFAALVAAAEREACAKVCDHMVMYGPVAEVQQRYNKAYADCRDAIRARSNA